MSTDPPDRRCLGALRCLQQCALGFEQAWKRGDQPRLEAYLPDETTLRPAVLLELVEADLALRLEAGESARVEQYLERFPELAKVPDTVLELLGTEYTSRWRREHGIRPAEYLQRFPELQEQVWSQLQSLDVRLGRQETQGPPEPPAATASVPVPHSRAALVRLSQTVQDLGAARSRGEQPGLETLLAAGIVHLRQATLVELIQIDLKNRLATGESVRVETYLGRYPEVSEVPGALLDLLETEYRQRWLREPEIRPAEYLQRFPQQEQVWARLQSLEVHLGEKDRGERPPDGRGSSTDAGTIPEALPTARPLLKATALAVSERPKVPGYEILSELGRGAMGVVYKARQTKLNRVVALKMLLAGGHADEAEMARFRAEARAAARLQHPNIVQIHEVGEHNGVPYLALEYCPGGSLAGHLKGSPLPPGLAARIIQRLARTIHAAHQRGIIHRDLKPLNVLLSWNDEDGAWSDSPSDPPSRPALDRCVFKIADFGLAKKLDASQDRTRTGAILGTPAYMAPEQAVGKSKEAAPTADVYALGAILYELLTGQPPFIAATPWEILLQVLSSEPAPPRRVQPRIPLDLETICLKCLQKEPEQRYPSAKALAQDLHYFLGGEPIDARRRGWIEQLLKGLRRRRAAVALGFVVLLAGVALVLQSIWHADELRTFRNAAEQARREASEARRKAVVAAEPPPAALVKPFLGTWKGVMEQAGQEPLPITMRLTGFRYGKSCGLLKAEGPPDAETHLVGVKVEGKRLTLAALPIRGHGRGLEGLSHLTLIDENTLERIWVDPRTGEPGASGKLERQAP
jgi:serine/threonine protein kinase